MLISRNLDDQNYTDIVEHAVKRIPQLCPGWTNYNAADPGITMVELLAWYKEMQQYHMNYYTDEMQLELLSLLGEKPNPTAPAQCMIELPDDSVTYPSGSRLYTPENIAFELLETVEAERAAICGIYSVNGDKWTDISPAFTGGSSSIPVFSFGVENKTDIAIAFSKTGKEFLSIWVEVADQGLPERNPFAKGQKMPRKLSYEFLGSGTAEPLCDDTKALSQSGFIRFGIPMNWNRTQIPGSGKSSYILKISLISPGCEEDVMLKNLTVSRHMAIQQETWSKLCETVSDEDFRTKATIDFDIKDENGDSQKIVCVMDMDHMSQLTYSSDGLPNQMIRIETNEKKLLTDRLTIVCSSKDAKGREHYELWHYTEDLHYCGPKDRVFTYDDTTNELCFGDGMNGRIPQAGEGNILLASMVLTDGAEGNIPSGSRLKWVDRDGVVYNTPAYGGRNRETLKEVSGRLMKRINEPKICVTAEDYERLAKGAPGRRVLAAHAVPGYNPDEPTGQNRIPVVTVIVVPAGTGYMPLPDEEFLASVEEYLEKHRMIGVMVKVRGPKYYPVEIRADIDTSARVEESEILNSFTENIRLKAGADSVEIGEPLPLSGIYRILEDIPGVVSVSSASIKSLNSACRITPTGDLDVPPDGVPYVKQVKIVQY